MSARLLDQPTLITAALLGIVEGLTEFLPISSTGHLIVAGSLLGYTGEQAKVFEIVIQAGAILAVCWEFRARLVAVAARHLHATPARSASPSTSSIAFLPAALLGLRVRQGDQGASVRAGACRAARSSPARFVILWAERRQRAAARHVRIADVDDMRWTDALKVGFAQAFALIPGTSRSGATIIGGMLFGLSRGRRPSSRSSSRSRRCSPRAATRCGRTRALLSAADLPASASASPRRSFPRSLCVRWLIRYVSRTRLRAVRVVPDRVRRGDPRHRVRRARALGLSASRGAAAGSARCAPSSACSAFRSRRS